MSAISLTIPLTVSITGAGPEIATPELTVGDLAVYRISISKENAARGILLPVNLNARAKVWRFQDIRIYNNSEYVYAIPPIALAFPPR